MTERHLHAGDNLDFFREVDPETVQMVYMDPPFASGRDYKAVMRSRRSGGSETVDAFSDIWNRDASPLRIESPKVHVLLNALAPALTPSLTNYLHMMASRIVEAWRVLEPRGSIYLHCDPAASHYLKMILDVVFGPENFRNEIVWRRTHAHSSSRRYGPVHDVILFYSKTGDYVWNQPYVPYAREYLDKYYTGSDSKGRYQLITCTGPGDRRGTRAHYEWRGQYPPPGRHWAWQVERMEELDAAGLLVHSATGVPRRKRYEHEAPGVALQDVWNDIGRLDAHSLERTGYETQKPISLLTRMISASTEHGGVVLDPFVGSGTTAVAAEELGRGWLVADRSLLAASLTLSRARRAAGEAPIRLSGFPSSKSEAVALRTKEPTTYGAWATSILGASIDRGRSSDEMTEGHGTLGAEISSKTRSWVPLRKPSGAPQMSESDVPGGVTIGLTFDSPISARILRARAARTGPNLRVINVPLEDAVSSATRSAGLASSLAADGAS
ncbi:MAG: site-specific DNA-methyltransferase [Microbacterium sp.]|uniref:site-specific DNA-methyltransferase n=1 Tax=Microbacterium sp. TaxID=51671 RepID=UPI001D4CCD23|nr:site-specific DNA-methyltransferase [Microbacterium sp.]MBW8762481.1 site-specific DNA-methyltransferase [Microbacterium sp.]